MKQFEQDIVDIENKKNPFNQMKLADKSKRSIKKSYSEAKK